MGTRARSGLVIALSLAAVAGLKVLPGCATGPEIVVILGEDPGARVTCSPASREVALRRDAPPAHWRLPAGLAPGPRWAILELAGASFGVLVEDAPGRAPRLWVDAVGGGDLAAAASLPGERFDGRFAYAGGPVTFRLPGDGGAHRDYRATVSYRSTDGADGTVGIASDAWRTGIARLGGREFRVLVRDADADGSYADLDGLELAFDRDNDGAVDADRVTGEGYGGDERFDLGTGTFRPAGASAAGDVLRFVPAWPRAAVRPFLGKGDPAPPLPPTDTGGRELSWAPYRGRKALLVFWSSW